MQRAAAECRRHEAGIGLETSNLRTRGSDIQNGNCTKGRVIVAGIVLDLQVSSFEISSNHGARNKNILSTGHMNAPIR